MGTVFVRNWSDESWDAVHRFVFTRYQQRLAEEGLVDFHDMIRKSVQLLATDSTLLGRYQQLFQVSTSAPVQS
jgi:superfamily I DNA/RNA helicase